MKFKQSIALIIIIFIVFSFLNLSCSSVKSAVACPEISLRKSDYRVHKRTRNTHTILAYKTNSGNQNNHRSGRIRKEESIPVITSFKVINDSEISKADYNKSLMASIDNTYHPLFLNVPASFPPKNDVTNIFEQSLQEIKCDTIVLRSGMIIVGKVEEIGQSELKYRRCNNLGGPLISVLKSDVSKINYSNGTSELLGHNGTYIPNQYYSSNQNTNTNPNINPNPNILSYNSTPAKTEGLGLAGFITGIVGLFVASIPLGIIAIIFGAISLSKINKNHHKYKGRGFAITSIIMGIVDVVTMLLILSSM
jgi:hypothetical protein